MVSYFAMYIGMLLRLANTTDWSVVSGLIVASLGNLPTSVYQMSTEHLLLKALHMLLTICNFSSTICLLFGVWGHLHVASSLGS